MRNSTLLIISFAYAIVCISSAFLDKPIISPAAANSAPVEMEVMVLSPEDKLDSELPLLLDHNYKVGRDRLLAMMVDLADGVYGELHGYTKQDITCQTRNIWHEARGEIYNKSYLGYALVAQTVLNRLDNGEYPNDVCDVIYQPKQFSWTHDHISDDVIANEKADRLNLWNAVLVSRNSFLGMYKGMLQGATQYYNPKYASPCWEKAYDDYIEYGNHRWGIRPNGDTGCFVAKLAAANKKRKLT